MRQPPEKESSGQVLRLLVEAEPGEDARGARRCRMRLDRVEPLVDLADMVGVVGVLEVGEQAGALACPPRAPFRTGLRVPAGASCAT